MKALNKLLVLSGLSLCVVFNAWATSQPIEALQLKTLINVYDGDTFRADLDGNFQMVCGENMGIRVNGIDTPEKRKRKGVVSELEAEAGKLVAKYVSDLLNKANSIDLRKLKRGKYFRLVADVYIDGESLAQRLIEEGFAKPYSGGRKTPWTEDELIWILETLQDYDPELIEIMDSP